MFNWFLILVIYIPLQIALNPFLFFEFFGIEADFLIGVDLASVRVFILVLFSLCLIKLFFKKESLIRDFLNFQGALLALFLLFATLSLIGAENVWWGGRKIIYFVSVFPLFFLTVMAYRSSSLGYLPKTLRAFKALVAGSGIMALFGLLQFMAPFVFGLGRVQDFWATNIVPVFSGYNLGSLILRQPSWFVNVGSVDIMRAFARFSDPHIFSFYLGSLLPLSVILFFLFKNIPSKIFFGLTSFLIFMGCLLSFARGSYLALILTFLLMAVLIWRYTDYKFLPWVLIFSLFVFVVPLTPISYRFYSSFDLAEGSNRGRLEMWEVSAREGLNQSLLGVGLGNYSLMVNPSAGYRNPITAHNFYLDIFSETGFLGLSVWLILIFSLVRKLFKKIKYARDVRMKLISTGLIASLVYFIIHGFFETPIYNPVFFSVFMVILAISSLIPSEAQSNN